MVVAINNKKCIETELYQYQNGAVNAERFYEFLKNIYKIAYNVINNKERPNYLSRSKSLSTGLDEPVKSKFTRSVKGKPYLFFI